MIPTAQSNASNSISHPFSQVHQNNHAQHRNTYAQKNQGHNQGLESQHFQNTSTGYNMTRALMFCQVCSRRGHTADRCWYRWDYAYQAQSGIPQALVTEDLDPTLYMDTGASAHITNDAGNLTNLAPYIGSDKVIIGDGSRLHISHIGDYVKYNNIKLNDVLVVPKIQKKIGLCF